MRLRPATAFRGIMQTQLNFDKPALTPQSQRLLDRLILSPITNAEMRDELRLLSYTRRIFEVRQAVAPRAIVKRHLGNGVFEYKLI
jgi:hypothetical protein